MKRILIADTPDGFDNLQRILGTTHHLVPAHTISRAIAAVQAQELDLIIVGVHFDESRAFDLIFRIKELPRRVSKPLIMFCSRDTPATRLMHDSLEVANRALGGWMYLDQHRYNVTQDPDAELRHVIERCLAGEARKRTGLERMDLQAQRVQIQQLRSDLLAEKWSLEIEDRLGSLRQKLSDVLLELSRAHLANIAQQEEIESSRERDDRVSSHVETGENAMAHAERDQVIVEVEQTKQEQSIVRQEEERGREGRRGLSHEHPGGKPSSAGD